MQKVTGSNLKRDGRQKLMISNVGICKYLHRVIKSYVVVCICLLFRFALGTNLWHCGKASAYIAAQCLCWRIIRSTALSRPNKVGLTLKCLSARPYVRPATKSFFDFDEIWYLGRGWWVMHDGVQYDPTKVKVTSHWKSDIRPFSKAISFPNYNGGWQIVTHS